MCAGTSVKRKGEVSSFDGRPGFISDPVFHIGNQVADGINFQILTAPGNGEEPSTCLEDIVKSPSLNSSSDRKSGLHGDLLRV